MAKFKDPLDNDKPFELPRAFVNNLSEFSPDGHLLFWVNQFGDIQVSANFDNQITEIGMRNFAMKLLQTIDSVESDELSERIAGEINNDEEEEE